MVRLAWPFPSTVTGDCGLPSTVNTTLPTGVPPPGAVGETVAVKVTGWPKTDGAWSELTASVVDAAMTVWANVSELVVKFASPLYCALIAEVPTGTVEVWSEAVALAVRGTVPIVVLEREKVTVPVGIAVPEVGVTVAWKVTSWPNTLGLMSEPALVCVPMRAAAGAASGPQTAPATTSRHNPLRNIFNRFPLLRRRRHSTPGVPGPRGW